VNVELVHRVEPERGEPPRFSIRGGRALNHSRPTPPACRARCLQMKPGPRSVVEHFRQCLGCKRQEWRRQMRDSLIGRAKDENGGDSSAATDPMISPPSIPAPCRFLSGSRTPSRREVGVSSGNAIKAGRDTSSPPSASAASRPSPEFIEFGQGWQSPGPRRRRRRRAPEKPYKLKAISPVERDKNPSSS
jgi:hypothetical protein